VENQLAVIACNTAGEHAGKQLGGRSVIVDATGAVLAEAGDAAETVIADLAPEATQRWRDRFPVLADRRRDIFAPEHRD
jgi:predicted amidohydrolase